MKRYLDIINHFGYRAQMKKLNEECYELLEAIDRYEDAISSIEHYDTNELHIFRENLVEEMGDVLILLTQFAILYQIDKEELEKHMDYKLERTENFIKDLLKKGECNE